MSNPIPGVVKTSQGEAMRFCPSCWADRVVKGGVWVVKPGKTRRFKCRSCRAKEKTKA